MLKRISRVLEAADDLLWPVGVTCPLCGEPAYGSALCGSCREALEKLRLQEPLCPQCGAELSEGGSCYFCRKNTLPGSGVRSAWRYQGAAAGLVSALKFKGIRLAAELMAEGMARAAASMPLPGNLVITHVTMPRKRYLERGIDHGREMAEALSRRLNVPARTLLVRNRRRDATQRGLGAQERKSNLRGAFSALPCEGLHVLLVDDVFTTGSTLSVCIRALLDAGCASVRAVTATRVHDRNELEDIRNL